MRGAHPQVPTIAPSNWGMYFNAPPRRRFAAPTTADGSTAEFGVEALTNPGDGTLWGLRVWFRSFAWLLAFGKPDDLPAELYRPRGLHITRLGESFSRTLNLSWPQSGHGHALLELTRLGELA